MGGLVMSVLYDIGKWFSDSTKGILDTIGLGTPIMRLLGERVDEDKVQGIISQINKLRLDRNNKIAYLESLQNIFDSADVQIPGALSSAIAREKKALEDKRGREVERLRTLDQNASIYEERLIDEASKPSMAFGIKDEEAEKAIKKNKEKLDAIQKEFSEEERL